MLGDSSSSLLLSLLLAQLHLLASAFPAQPRRIQTDFDKLTNQTRHLLKLTQDLLVSWSGVTPGQERKFPLYSEMLMMIRSWSWASEQLGYSNAPCKDLWTGIGLSLALSLAHTAAERLFIQLAHIRAEIADCGSFESMWEQIRLITVASIWLKKTHRSLGSGPTAGLTSQTASKPAM